MPPNSPIQKCATMPTTPMSANAYATASNRREGSGIARCLLELGDIVVVVDPDHECDALLGKRRWGIEETGDQTQESKTAK